MERGGEGNGVVVVVILVVVMVVLNGGGGQRRKAGIAGGQGRRIGQRVRDRGRSG